MINVLELILVLIFIAIVIIAIGLASRFFITKYFHRIFSYAGGIDSGNGTKDKSHKHKSYKHLSHKDLYYDLGKNNNQSYNEYFCLNGAHKPLISGKLNITPLNATDIIFNRYLSNYLKNPQGLKINIVCDDDTAVKSIQMLRKRFTKSNNSHDILSTGYNCNDCDIMIRDRLDGSYNRPRILFYALDINKTKEFGDLVEASEHYSDVRVIKSVFSDCADGHVYAILSHKLKSPNNTNRYNQLSTIRDNINEVISRYKKLNLNASKQQSIETSVDYLLRNYLAVNESYHDVVKELYAGPSKKLLDMARNKLFPKEPSVDISKAQLGYESTYSITYPYLTDKIKTIIVETLAKDKLSPSDLTITDATANVGGDTLAFSKYFGSVNSIEFNSDNCKMLKHNINLYGRKNVNVICDDFNNCLDLEQDVIYFDPPWGGHDYYSHSSLDLYLGKNNIIDIVGKVKSKYVIMKVPFNYNVKGFKQKYKNTTCHNFKNILLLVTKR